MLPSSIFPLQFLYSLPLILSSSVYFTTSSSNNITFLIMVISRFSIAPLYFPYGNVSNFEYTIASTCRRKNFSCENLVFFAVYLTLQYFPPPVYFPPAAYIYIDLSHSEYYPLLFLHKFCWICLPTRMYFNSFQYIFRSVSYSYHDYFSFSISFPCWVFSNSKYSLYCYLQVSCEIQYIPSKEFHCCRSYYEKQNYLLL